jgi:hypothetical protein
MTWSDRRIDSDAFDSVTAFLALLCFCLVLVLVTLNATKHHESGGGATSGAGTYTPRAVPVLTRCQHLLSPGAPCTEAICMTRSILESEGTTMSTLDIIAFVVSGLCEFVGFPIALWAAWHGAWNEGVFWVLLAWSGEYSVHNIYERLRRAEKERAQ